MSDTQIKVWFTRFKNGRTSVKSDLRSGRSITTKIPENVERVKVMIIENRRLTVREIEEDLSIPKTIVSEILSQELGMSCVAPKFVPRLLTKDQKSYRVEVARNNLYSIRKQPEVFSKIITGDESSWDDMTPRQRSNLHSGNSLKSHDPKKYAKVEAMLSNAHYFFLTIKVLFTMNTP